MRYIYNYTIIPTTVDKEGLISNHLLHGHYPHCIDTTGDRIIAFNVPEEEMRKIMALFEIKDWEYHDYVKLPNKDEHIFKMVNQAIEKNLNVYWNFIRMRGQEKPKENVLDNFVNAAFADTDYNSWRRRFYLSIDIMGFKNQPSHELRYNVTEPLVQKLREQLASVYNHVRIFEDSYACGTRRSTDFIIDIFYEPDRLYCGCFCYEPNQMANSHFVKSIRKIREENPDSFSGAASIRQVIGNENVEKRLTELGIERGKFSNLLPEWGWRTDF